MSFYKDIGGFILFFLCHINFILQYFFIYTITSEENTILIYHKIINYIFLLLTVYSHLKTSLINPGEITVHNNREIIEFYYHIHEPLIKRALYIIEKRTPEVVKKIIMGEAYNENKSENEEDNDSSNSDKDDYEFETVTTINDNMKKIIEEKYKMKVSRCINCYVVRPLNSHHCTVCHKCFIEQDHHCPWVNNCIGLFNKKYFWLFLLYGCIEFVYSLILFFYYSLYKNRQNLMLQVHIVIIDVFAIVFGLIQAIVSVMLLSDQYEGLLADCTQCDLKKGILWEKSTLKQQFQIIMGGLFSYKWLLPFFPGGNKIFYEQLCDYLKSKKDNKNKNNKTSDETKDKND